MAPSESAGSFMGWVIEPGCRYRSQLIIADLDNFRNGTFSRRLLKQCPESEVHFRDAVVFPFAAVADANIDRPLQRHAIGDDPDGPPVRVDKAADATPTVDSPEIPDIPADFYITKSRIQRWGATEGCPGCARPGTQAKHTPTCKARFYQILLDSGYEIHSKASGSSAPENEIVKRTQREIDEEQMLEYAIAMEDIDLKTGKKKRGRPPKANLSIQRNRNLKATRSTKNAKFPIHGSPTANGFDVV